MIRIQASDTEKENTMNSRRIWGTVFAATLLVASEIAGAVPVTISGYDILHTPGSGHGGWSHAYTGTIAADGLGALNYSGGSGSDASWRRKSSIAPARG